MALPSSTDPLRLAVQYALTTVTTKPRTLTASRLFKIAWPAEIVERPATLKGQPRCFVVVKDDDVGEDGFTLLSTSSFRMVVTVQVTTWYWMGSELVKSEVDTALLRIAEDKLRVAACLSYPGALALSPAGAQTGLDGDALRLDLGYRTIGPNPMPVSSGSEERVMRVDHVFRTSVELLPPT